MRKINADFVDKIEVDGMRFLFIKISRDLDSIECFWRFSIKSEIFGSYLNKSDNCIVKLCPKKWFKIGDFNY